MCELGVVLWTVCDVSSLCSVSVFLSNSAPRASFLVVADFSLLVHYTLLLIFFSEFTFPIAFLTTRLRARIAHLQRVDITLALPVPFHAYLFAC